MTNWENIAGDPEKLVDNFVPWEACCALGYVIHVGRNYYSCGDCPRHDECEIELEWGTRSSWEKRREWAIEWLQEESD